MKKTQRVVKLNFEGLTDREIDLSYNIIYKSRHISMTINFLRSNSPSRDGGVLRHFV